MNLSKRESRSSKFKCGPINFDPDKLSETLWKKAPQVDFAFLLGSAMNGNVRPDADLDVAVYFDPQTTVQWDLLCNTINIVEDIVPGIECDLGVLNKANVIYRFESIKGKLLFVREKKLEEYLNFYSLTCREHEDKIFWMKQQLNYRGYCYA